jgi:uncharacterized protein (TIGR03437 family)
MLFAANVDPNSAISVTAVKSGGATYQLPVEYVGKSPGMDSVTTIIVILPQDSTLHGDIAVSLTAAGIKSNSVVFAIQ